MLPCTYKTSDEIESCQRKLKVNIENWYLYNTKLLLMQTLQRNLVQTFSRLKTCIENALEFVSHLNRSNPHSI